MDYRLKVKKKADVSYSDIDIFPDTIIDFDLDFYDVNNIDKVKVPLSVDLSLPMSDYNVSVIDYDPRSSTYSTIPSDPFDFQLFANGLKVLEGNMYVQSYSFNNNIPIVSIRLVDKLQEIFSTAREASFSDLYSDYNTLTSFDSLLSSFEGTIGQEPTKNDIMLPYVDMCNDVQKFDYAARQFIQFGFDKDRAGLIPSFSVPSFMERFFDSAGVNVTSRFLELGSYGSSIPGNNPEDLYMLLPTKLESSSRTRTRGFYLVNGPYDLFRTYYTADADATISTAREIESYESVNMSYGWNYSSSPYNNPVDNSFGLDLKTNEKNTGDNTTKAYFGSHMSYPARPTIKDIYTGNDRSIPTGSTIAMKIPMIQVATNNYAMVSDIYPSTSTGVLNIVATLWIDGSPAESFRMCNLDGSVKNLPVSSGTVSTSSAPWTAYRVSVNNDWGYIDGPNTTLKHDLVFSSQTIGNFMWEQRDIEIDAGSTYSVSIGFELISGEIDVQYVSSWLYSYTGGGGVDYGTPNSYGTKSIDDSEFVKGIFVENSTNIGWLYLAINSIGKHNPYFLDDDVNLYWAIQEIPYTPFDVAKQIISRFNLSAVYNQNDNTIIIDRLSDIRDPNAQDITDKIDDASGISVDVVNKIAKSIEIKSSQTSLFYDQYGYGKKILNPAGSDELSFSLESRFYNKSLCGGETFLDIPNGINEYEIGFTLNQFTKHTEIGIVFGYIGSPQYSTRLRRGKFVDRGNTYKGILYDVIKMQKFPRFLSSKSGSMPLNYFDEQDNTTDLYNFFVGNDNILYYGKPIVNLTALLPSDYAFDIKGNYSVVSTPLLNNSDMIIKSVKGKWYDGGVYGDIEAIIL